MKQLSYVAIGMFAAAVAFAADAPPPPTRGAASAKVANKTVSIDYGRPALKGRSISDLLKQLPEDRMWRAGENEVTTLTTEGDVTIGGKKVPQGKYSLYVHIPAEGDWALAINRDLGVPLGTIYDKAPEEKKHAPWPHITDYQKSIGDKEVARIPLTRGKAAGEVEQLAIDLQPAGKGAKLVLSWGDQSWSADVKAAK
jgi:hypothetical protein